MFCRFGRIDESRPVAAVVWLNVVCRRPSAGIDQVGQRHEIGVQELRLLAPLLDDVDDRVQVADLLQHACVGRVAGLAAAVGRQSQALEEHLAELLRRADHERPARELVAARLELLDLVGQLGGDLGQAVGVDADAGRLHRPQHRHERQLDLLVERGHLPLGEALGGPRVQAADGRSGAHERRRLLVGLGLQAEARLLGHLVDLVRRAAGIEQVRRKGGVARGRECRVLEAVREHAVVAQRLDDAGRRRPRRRSRRRRPPSPPPGRRRPRARRRARARAHPRVALAPLDLDPFEHLRRRAGHRLLELVQAL